MSKFVVVEKMCPDGWRPMLALEESRSSHGRAEDYKADYEMYHPGATLRIVIREVK